LIPDCPKYTFWGQQKKTNADGPNQNEWILAIIVGKYTIIQIIDLLPKFTVIKKSKASALDIPSTRILKDYHNADISEGSQLPAV
jgi:hypothetical protein